MQSTPCGCALLQLAAGAPHLVDRPAGRIGEQQVSGLVPGELVHVIADAHIYDRHIPLIEELISRETHLAPTFKLNPEIKNFYDFTTKDIMIENYVTGPQIKNIPIAV